MSAYSYDRRPAQRAKWASVEERWVTGGERHELLEPIWEMYKSSYQKIGLHITSASELMEYDKWEVFFHNDKPVGFNLYKVTPLGLKAGLLGSDGSSEGKGAVKAHVKARYKIPGVYAEVSHAIEHMSEGAPVVCAVYVPRVLHKVVTPMEDGVHYSRQLGGMGVVTKKLVGNPRGVPSGSEHSCPVPENPGKPLAPEDAPKYAASMRMSFVMEQAEHASCQLDFE